LQLERVDLRAIVRHALETSRPQATQKAQSLTESLPDEPVWVQGDAVRLEQVVVNLLNNASKYTDRNGQIGVTLQNQDGEAVLRVRDNGVGIAPEMLPRIFDLFTQVDQSLDRAQGGLGIGLALVQSLVTLHGGRVQVHSTPGQGSEFVVELPVSSSPHEPALIGAEKVSAPVRPRKVLVVDDNVDAAESFAMLLQMAGHETRLAHDGADAMKAVRAFKPDVVLLDLGLPIIDGFAVARLIRQDAALRNVVLVALTGYGQDGDRQRTSEAGFDHHLVKPVDIAKVESILSTVADTSR
jgi:CheY-like chemotaxis protein